MAHAQPHVRALDAFPIAFERNAGQVDTDAPLVAHGGGYALLLTDGGATLRLPGLRDVRMTLRGGREDAVPRARPLCPGRSITSSAATRASGAPTFPRTPGPSSRMAHVGIGTSYPSDAGFNITQLGSCDVVVTPESSAVPRAGGTGLITASIWPPSCAWVARSDASWLTTSATVGAGSAALSFTAAPNPGFLSRTGHLVVAEQTLTVTQQGPVFSNMPSVLPPSPAAGSGAAQTFTFTFYDSNNAINLDVVNVLINDFLDGRFGCYIAHARPLNVLYLVNDAGNALLPGLVLDGNPQSVATRSV